MFSILFTTSLLSLGMARGESLLVSGYSSNIEVFTLTGSPANHTLEKDSMWPVDANHKGVSHIANAIGWRNS